MPNPAAHPKWKPVFVLFAVLTTLVFAGCLGFAIGHFTHPARELKYNDAWLYDGVQLFSLTLLFAAFTSIAQRVSRTAH